jgi:hypothetical protein
MGESLPNSSDQCTTWNQWNICSSNVLTTSASGTSKQIAPRKKRILNSSSL